MSAITSLDKETFKNLIKNSHTWTEVMIYFRDNHGYTNIKSGKTAKKRCIKENISFSHFNNGNPKIELAKTNKPYHTKTLKKQLYKDGLLTEMCSKCGLGSMWHGKPIVLQLEHIDGDHYNNEISNLTILCPNCHSQTPTWCGRSANNVVCACLGCKKRIKKGTTRCKKCTVLKKHKENNTEPKEDDLVSEPEFGQYNCIDCNESITERSTRCQSCASKKFNVRKVPDRPSLEQLIKDYKELKSMVAVGKKYGVSDNAVNKWLKGYNIQEHIRDLAKN